MFKKIGWVSLNCIALLFVLFGLFTLVTLTSRGVSALLIALGLVVLLCANLPRVANLRHNRALNLIHKVLCVLVAFGALFALVISCFMLFGFRSYQGRDFDGTVIVLGCHIKGDQPSVMLAGRLDKAAEFLKENPRANCIVSGGRGKDEMYSEAEIMKKYLTEKGISPQRILEENQSVNTQTNLRNSKQMMEEKGLGKTAVIVTDRFHQYRAQLCADRIQLNSQSVPCETRPDLLVAFWLREIPAVLQAWLFA
ncbi:MAG: YdcF family protein [Massilioclostridium sp.]|nr:YdcF family protein [Massilioclostridium sp.]MEE1491467.1 YdcF family protein [Massilioclostridium sp.]